MRVPIPHDPCCVWPTLSRRPQGRPSSPHGLAGGRVLMKAFQATTAIRNPLLGVFVRTVGLALAEGLSVGGCPFRVRVGASALVSAARWTSLAYLACVPPVETCTVVRAHSSQVLVSEPIALLSGCSGGKGLTLPAPKPPSPLRGCLGSCEQRTGSTAFPCDAILSHERDDCLLWKSCDRRPLGEILETDGRSRCCPYPSAYPSAA